MGKYGFIDVSRLQLLNGFNKIGSQLLIDTIEGLWDLTGGDEKQIKIIDAKCIKYDLIRLFRPSMMWNETLCNIVVNFLWYTVLVESWNEGDDFVTIRPYYNFNSRVFNNKKKEFQVLYPGNAEETSYTTKENVVFDELNIYGYGTDKKLNTVTYHNVDGSNIKSILEDMERREQERVEKITKEREEALSLTNENGKSHTILSETENRELLLDPIRTQKETRTLLKQYKQYQFRTDNYGRRCLVSIVKSLIYIYETNIKYGYFNNDEITAIYNKWKKKPGRPKDNRIILCIDPQTNEVVERYQSVSDIVSLNEGYTAPGINQVLNGKRKAYRGYIWKYKD